MLKEQNHPVYWPGWVTKRRICGQGSGSLWELQRADGSETVTVKYICIPKSAQELRQQLAQGQSREQISLYYDYLCQNALEEYNVSAELGSCRHTALYRNMQKRPADDGLGWNILLMMDDVVPIDRCLSVPSQEDVLQLGREVCLALEDSGSLGLLHGRITPRCIFRDRAGSYRLGGFAGEHFTDLGNFQAPEVAGSQFCDTRADVYSLGMVLYWLLNDRWLPEGNLRPPRNGSEALKTVVCKAIAPDARYRYASPAELRRALEQIPAAEQQPPSPTPVSRTPVSPTPVSRTTVSPVRGPRRAAFLLGFAALVFGLLLFLLFRPDSGACAKGHTWTAADCSTPQTCQVCGLTQGSPLNHIWIDTTCENPKTCAVCGTVSGTPLGHAWTTATCETPKSCTVCGITEGAAPGHTWIAATCEAPKSCAVCGITEGSPLEHSWIPATFLEPMRCSVCGGTQGEAVSYSHLDAEEYELSVRKIYTKFSNQKTNYELRKQELRTGITYYYDRSGTLRGIIVLRGTEGIGIHSSTYSRTYVFQDGQLVFAIYEGDDTHTHRFYFYEELLFRWKYSSPSGSAEYHTLEFSDTYFYWESLVKEEVNSLLDR